MSQFPKPWRIVPVGPEEYVVYDANDQKLFFIHEDDNPDGDGKPGDHDGPTVLGYHDDEADLLIEIANTFEAR